MFSPFVAVPPLIFEVYRRLLRHRQTVTSLSGQVRSTAAAMRTYTTSTVRARFGTTKAATATTPSATITTI